MQIAILTAFPPMFTGPFDYSIVKKAKDKSGLTITLHDLRHWATDNYKAIDDRPYGGGPGMILRVDLIDRAITDIKSQLNGQSCKVILMDAGGEKLSQNKAQALSQEENLIIICGHYEGVDHRVHERIADDVISIGDYVLSGGELPAMVLVDTVVRLLPGALGNAQSLAEESHTLEGAEYPQYTRPDDYKGWTVPEVLLSGDHKKIAAWRKK